MSSARWQIFAQRACDVARQYGAVINTHTRVVEFVNPKTGAAIRISEFETGESVRIEAGRFLQLEIDIAPDYMADDALACLTAIFEGGAAEFVAVRRGEARTAGYVVRLPDGGMIESKPLRWRRRRVTHKLAAWI